MTQEHPITLPPELVEQWYETADNSSKDVIQEVATQSARWGADQELEACCEWMRQSYQDGFTADLLRSARRPEPSLKEQALAALYKIEDKMLGPTVEEKLIRRALESLPS